MKIGIGFKILLVTIPSFLTFFFIYSVQNKSLESYIEQSEWMTGTEQPLTKAIYDLKKAFSQEEVMVLSYIAGLKNRKIASELIEDAELKIKASIEIFRKHPEEVPQDALQRTEQELREEDEIREALFEAHINGKKKETELILLFGKKVEFLHHQIDSVQSNLTHRKSSFFEKLISNQKRDQKKLGTLFLVALFLSLAFATLISRWITRPLKNLLEVFEQIKMGNTSVRAGVSTHDEFKVLGQGFNGMVESLIYSRTLVAQSAKMSSLGELASGIAHEINNPLTIVKAVSQRLRRAIGDKTLSIEKMTYDLDLLVRTSQRIHNIVRGLKGYSRNSDNDTPQTESIRVIINDCKELITEKYRDNAVELKIQCDDSVKAFCWSSQIFQVIMNLLVNACDAVEKLPERWVLLEAGPLPSDQSRVFIRVTDSGEGIPDDVLEKLMTPFFTTKPLGKGTGLGLSISKGIIERHGGRFFYEKNADHTSFVVELPTSEK